MVAAAIILPIVFLFSYVFGWHAILLVLKENKGGNNELRCSYKLDR